MSDKSEVTSDNSLVVGVDIGGTKIAAGLVDSSGRIVFQTRTPMIANDGAEGGLSAVKSAIESLLNGQGNGARGQSSIGGIGICSPGPLDPKTGVVINPPNLPCWRNFPLAAEISQIYRMPVSVDNDANAAGLAEVLWGAGRGYHNVFYATIGTGIGTAILFDGAIYHGRTGAAAEGGHMSIDYRGPVCGCGKPGCIEALASGPAIARRAREKLKGSRSSVMRDLASGNVELVSSEIVGRAYEEGDAVAAEVLLETVELLKFWLGNVVDLLEPDIMIIGGGVASMLLPFFQEIRDGLPSCCINQRCSEIPLVPARYGADSGIAGGAALCWQVAKAESVNHPSLP